MSDFPVPGINSSLTGQAIGAGGLQLSQRTDANVEGKAFLGPGNIRSLQTTTTPHQQMVAQRFIRDGVDMDGTLIIGGEDIPFAPMTHYSGANTTNPVYAFAASATQASIIGTMALWYFTDGSIPTSVLYPALQRYLCV